MDKKLIVFDIDGTLFDQKKVSDQTIQAIKQVRQLGHTVSLATGRNHVGIYRFAEMLGLNDGQTPLIGLNGAEVFSVDQEKNFKFIWERNFSDELAKLVISTAWTNKLDFFAYTNNRQVHYVARLFSPFSIAMRIFRKAKLVKLKKDFSNFDCEVKKFIVYGSQKKMSKFLEVIKPYNFAIFQWSSTKDPKANIEVNIEGTDKVIGIQEVAKLMHFNQEDVIYFGDGSNDVEALKWAGTGVAMGNARQEVASYANEQTLSIEEDGVAHWLQKNLIDKKA